MFADVPVSSHADAAAFHQALDEADRYVGLIEKQLKYCHAVETYGSSPGLRAMCSAQGLLVATESQSVELSVEGLLAEILHTAARWASSAFRAVIGFVPSLLSAFLGPKNGAVRINQKVKGLRFTNKSARLIGVPTAAALVTAIGVWRATANATTTAALAAVSFIGSMITVAVTSKSSSDGSRGFGPEDARGAAEKISWDKKDGTVESLGYTDENIRHMAQEAQTCGEHGESLTQSIGRSLRGCADKLKSATKRAFTEENRSYLREKFSKAFHAFIALVRNVWHFVKTVLVVGFRSIVTAISRVSEVMHRGQQQGVTVVVHGA